MKYFVEEWKIRCIATALINAGPLPTNNRVAELVRQETKSNLPTDRQVKGLIGDLKKLGFLDKEGSAGGKKKKTTSKGPPSKKQKLEEAVQDSVEVGGMKRKRKGGKLKDMSPNAAGSDKENGGSPDPELVGAFDADMENELADDRSSTSIEQA